MSGTSGKTLVISGHASKDYNGILEGSTLFTSDLELIKYTVDNAIKLDYTTIAFDEVYIPNLNEYVSKLVRSNRVNVYWTQFTNVPTLSIENTKFNYFNNFIDLNK